MPPRRKRGGKIAGRKTRSGKPLSLDLLKNCEMSTEAPAKKEREEKDVEAAPNTTFQENIITTRSHKKFGKFRFLIENEGQQANNANPENATDDTSKETNDVQDYENNLSKLNENELDETSTSEISQQLINLKMEYAEAKALNVEANSQKIADSVVHVDSVENEVMVECVAEEEIIPMEENFVCQKIEISDHLAETETEYENIIEMQADNEEKASNENEMMECVEQQVYLVEQQEEIEEAQQYIIDNQCTDEIAENLQLLELQTEVNEPNKLEATENRIEDHIECVEEIVTEEICEPESTLQETKLILKENLSKVTESDGKQEILLEDAIKTEDISETVEMNKASPVKSDCSERRRSKRRMLQKIKDEETKVVVENDMKDVKELEVKSANEIKEEIVSLVDMLEESSIQDNEAENSSNRKLKKSKAIKDRNDSDDQTKNDERKTKKQQSAKPRKQMTNRNKERPRNDRKKVPKQENSDNSESSIRRSSRIKSISVLKQKSKGHGLVKTKRENLDLDEDNSNNETESDRNCLESNFAAPKLEHDQKPVKVKSRWRRSSELEMGGSNSPSRSSPLIVEAPVLTQSVENEKPKVVDEEVEKRLKQFVHLKENQYLTERVNCKEAKKMTCDCFLTQDEIDRKEFGCGEDCLNRLLMIECGSYCSVGDRCTNKRFQKSQFAPCEVFKTEKKGLGIRAAANIPYGEFILEYVGEVLDPEEFERRAEDYSKDKNIHYYFMSLRADAVIDATQKGNISRFINHSCDPNAETQKWTVNGELRIGFFSKRTILAGEEITFDYQFQRYGKEAQKCYCEASVCRGWLGEEPDDEDDEEEDEEEEEEVVKEEMGSEKVPVEDLPKTEVKKVVKKEKKKLLKAKKSRKDIFDDLDLDEEIETLLTTGLKNQAHTLKLSRLMVRAKELSQRIKLVNLLQQGELPCRRLFLDYHGLRLIHGWMTDAQPVDKVDRKTESLRLDLLQTLAALPIPNKTMLKDSKVLTTVEKWSKSELNSENSPLDSESNSPNETDSNPQQKEEEIKQKEVEINIEEILDDCIRKSVGMGTESKNIAVNMDINNKNVAEEISDSFQEDMDISPIAFEEVKEPPKPEVKEEVNYIEKIIALALKLLDDWSSLKEVFRIPKKERIEQMKEHEREADRRYKAGLNLEQYNERRNENRYRLNQRHKPIEKIDSLERLRKGLKSEEHKVHNVKLNKQERRKLFALKVEQETEERRRQQDLWRQHEKYCFMIGADPRLTAPFDPNNRGFQYVWNPQTGQWQNYSLPNQIHPPNMPQNYHFGTNNITLPNNLTPIPTNMSNHNINLLPNNFQSISPIVSNIPNNLPPLPSLPYQDKLKEKKECSQIRFMGPIPPPVTLPPKWKCAKDKYGRPYYYHIKIRKSQWEPPEIPVVEEQDELSDSTSSSDTSSLSSDTSSEESDSDDDLDDTKLLLEIRKKFKHIDEESKIKETGKGILLAEQNASEVTEEIDEEESATSSIDKRLLEEFSLKKDENSEEPPVKKKRVGLVQEIIISPRTEEDRLQFKEDLKKYKENKEKLRKQKEVIMKQTKKHVDVTVHKTQKHAKKHKVTVKTKLKEISDNSEASKKIKETFRSNMAGVMVSILNAYRKPECKEGRITNTEDFKHLARKLTHFVMLKELKHCQKIEELTCTESVKSKAKEFVKKYMSKFGEVYLRPKDDCDNY